MLTGVGMRNQQTCEYAVQWLLYKLLCRFQPIKRLHVWCSLIHTATGRQLPPPKKRLATLAANSIWTMSLENVSTRSRRCRKYTRVHLNSVNKDLPSRIHSAASSCLFLGVCAAVVAPDSVIRRIYWHFRGCIHLRTFMIVLIVWN